MANVAAHFRDEALRCPICSEESPRSFSSHGCAICECKSCRHSFVALTPDESQVQKVYSDAYFSGGGDGYHDYCEPEALAPGEINGCFSNTTPGANAFGSPICPLPGGDSLR